MCLVIVTCEQVLPTTTNPSKNNKTLFYLARRKEGFQAGIAKNVLCIRLNCIVFFCYSQFSISQFEMQVAGPRLAQARPQNLEFTSKKLNLCLCFFVIHISSVEGLPKLKIW